MNEESKEVEKKDFLFVVPDQFLMRYTRIIKRTLWAVESPKTVSVISGDAFASLYGEMPISDVVTHIRAHYKQVGTLGDLSRRERKAYDKIMAGVMEAIKSEKDAEGKPQP